MARQRVDRTYDHDLRLKNAGAVSASGAGEHILDIGGPPQDATRDRVSRTDGCVVVDVTSIVTSSANNRYEIWSQYSDSPTFASSSDIVNGQGIAIGNNVALQGANVTAGVGRYEFGATNEINGTAYRYMRLYVHVTGTSASINLTGALYL